MAHAEAWVTKVKESQRGDPKFKEAWITWCDEHSDGKRDPGLMDLPTLKKAWGQCNRIAKGGAGGGRPAGGVAGTGRGRPAASLKRIDPADGNAYTKEEFVAEYGGYDEWDAAKPVGGAGRGRGAPPRAAPYRAPARAKEPPPAHTAGFLDALAAQVQERQKADKDFRAKWAQLAGGRYGKCDPRLLTGGQIRSALAEIDGYDPSTAAVYAEVALEQIKTVPGFRDNWREYCLEHTGGTMDPRRMSQGEVQEGLKQCGYTGLKDLAAHAKLAAQVKKRQRSDKAFDQRYRSYCTANCRANDPARLSLAQLTAAIEAADQ